MLLLLVAATVILQHTAGASGIVMSSLLAKQGCRSNCGGVDIPYPFGIGHGCFLQEQNGFEVLCDREQASVTISNADNGSAVQMNVLEIKVIQGEVRVQNILGLSTGFFCNYTDHRTEGDIWTPTLSLRGTPFMVSKTKNKFTVVGCATIGIIQGKLHRRFDDPLYTTACASVCDDERNIDDGAGECSGMGCCQSPLPGNLTDFSFAFSNQVVHNPEARDFSPCGYSFVVEEESFKFNPSYAKSRNFIVEQEELPLVLDWSVGNQTCAEAKKMESSYACCADNSECINVTNGPGYLCNCASGFDGNPYLEGGCQNINECNDPSLYPCNGTCTDIIGSYICSCPIGTHSKDPKNQPCTPATNMVIGSFISLLFLIVCISALLIKCQKRQLAKEKKRFFKQNGGHILYQQILSKQINTVIIFTIEDLNKATTNFDNSRELGTEGHGTVYKGILEDNKVVAVKRSNIINVAQTEEFVQELIILSQINHRNVVRLLGCCLEVEVPVLVYEYIPNGTLFELIHENKGRTPPSLEERLRIAQESAEALEYLHISINRPIVHGDVKSLNILLDGNYRAKVTDFGASRMLPTDAIQLMTMVQGTLGYLDPEYLQDRKLTEKSDVYSFGVVLLELITRKTAIYFEGLKERKNLASSFLLALRENRINDILDPSIMGVGMEELLQEVAELASLCLSYKGEERPSMTQVADKLEVIRSTWGEILLLKHNETTSNREVKHGFHSTKLCDISKIET